MRLIRVSLYEDQTARRFMDVGSDHEPEWAASSREAGTKVSPGAEAYGKRIKIEDLIELGLLFVGDELVWDRTMKGTRYDATVTETGIRLSDGREYWSPSGAACAAEIPAYDGWHAWTVTRTSQSLHEVRMELAKRHLTLLMIKATEGTDRMRVTRPTGSTDPLDDLVMVPYDEIDRDCCRAADVREQLLEESHPQAISETHAYLPVSHWTPHLFEGASDKDVAEAMHDRGIATSPVAILGQLSTEHDIDEAVARPEIAKAELRRRGYSVPEVEEIAAGQRWPD